MKKRKIVGLAVVGIVVVGIGAAVAGGGSSGTTTKPIADPAPSTTVGKGFGSKDASADVVFKDAKTDVAGFVTATVIVTNNSEKPSDYFVTVGAFKDDVRVDESLPATVTHLAPGAVAEADALFADAKGADSYKVTEVSRTASN